jgi:hypothetical protein
LRLFYNFGNAECPGYKRNESNIKNEESKNHVTII